MPREESRTEIDFTNALDTSAAASLLDKDPVAQVKEGDLLDERFLLERELGRGGMSIVFRARDLFKEKARDPDPHVAVKVLTGRLSEHPEAWIALQREINKAQTLAHPRIVTVHDFKVDRSSGVPFAQMEELRGESLLQFMKRYPEGLKDKDKLEEIVLSIAEGLEYAHGKGIVHADLKPSNVFLTESGGIKLLDFGISRFISGQDGDFFDKNQLCALTPAYASPQLFDGEVPGPADDIFALGIICCELGTGKHPFEGQLISGRRWAPVQIVVNKMRCPEAATPAQWKIIKSCISPYVEQRPQDGEAFLAQFRRRDKTARVLGTLAVVLACVALVGWLLPRGPQPEVSVEDLPVERRAQLMQALENGEDALVMQDFNGALVHFSNAFDLHPFNPEAMKGLDSVVDAVVGEDTPAQSGDAERRIAQINILLEYPALADSARLLDYRKRIRESLRN